MSRSDTDQWKVAGEPLPTSAVHVDSDECSYGDCDNGADYLVKAETVDGVTAKTRICQSCNDEHQIWAERHLPPDSEPAGGDA